MRVQFINSTTQQPIQDPVVGDFEEVGNAYNLFVAGEVKKDKTVGIISQEKGGEGDAVQIVTKLSTGVELILEPKYNQA